MNFRRYGAYYDAELVPPPGSDQQRGFALRDLGEGVLEVTPRCQSVLVRRVELRKRDRTVFPRKQRFRRCPRSWGSLGHWLDHRGVRRSNDQLPVDFGLGHRVSVQPRRAELLSSCHFDIGTIRIKVFYKISDKSQYNSGTTFHMLSKYLVLSVIFMLWGCGPTEDKRHSIKNAGTNLNLKAEDGNSQCLIKDYQAPAYSLLVHADDPVSIRLEELKAQLPAGLEAVVEDDTRPMADQQGRYHIPIVFSFGQKRKISG